MPMAQQLMLLVDPLPFKKSAQPRKYVLLCLIVRQRQCTLTCMPTP
jgi:hypothetical protein